MPEVIELFPGALEIFPDEELSITVNDSYDLLEIYKKSCGICKSLSAVNKELIVVNNGVRVDHVVDVFEEVFNVCDETLMKIMVSHIKTCQPSVMSVWASIQRHKELVSEIAEIQSVTCERDTDAKSLKFVRAKSIRRKEELEKRCYKKFVAVARLIQNTLDNFPEDFTWVDETKRFMMQRYLMASKCFKKCEQMVFQLVVGFGIDPLRRCFLKNYCNLRMSFKCFTIWFENKLKLNSKEIIPDFFSELDKTNLSVLKTLVEKLLNVTTLMFEIYDCAHKPEENENLVSLYQNYLKKLKILDREINDVSHNDKIEYEKLERIREIRCNLPTQPRRVFLASIKTKILGFSEGAVMEFCSKMQGWV